MAPRTEDLDQEKSIGKAFTAIARLEGEFKEIKTALIGIDGRNGLRGELREFAERVEAQTEAQNRRTRELEEWRIDIEKRLQEYLHVTRPQTCIGKKALEEYVEQVEAKVEEHKDERRRSDRLSVELTKTRNTFRAAILVALITTAGTVFVSANGQKQAPTQASSQEAKK